MNKGIKLIALLFAMACLLPLGTFAQNLSKKEICNIIVNDKIYNGLIEGYVINQFAVAYISENSMDEILANISKSSYGIKYKEWIEHIKERKDKRGLGELMKITGYWKELFAFSPVRCYYTDEIYHVVGSDGRTLEIPNNIVSMCVSETEVMKKDSIEVMNTDFGEFFKMFVKDEETQLSLINIPFRESGLSGDYQDEIVNEKNESKLKKDWKFMDASDFNIGFLLEDSGKIGKAEWLFDKKDKNTVYYNIQGMESGINFVWIFKKIDGKWKLYEFANSSI